MMCIVNLLSSYLASYSSLDPHPSPQHPRNLCPSRSRQSQESIGRISPSPKASTSSLTLSNLPLHLFRAHLLIAARPRLITFSGLRI